MKLFSLILSLFLFAATFNSCTKDHDPEVYGSWETVNAVGFHWFYTFDKGGQACRNLPEYFLDTSFCYDYSVSGNVVNINAPNDETWQWEFICEDVADVTVTYPDGEIQRFILKRL